MKHLAIEQEAPPSRTPDPSLHHVPFRMTDSLHARVSRAPYEEQTPTHSVWLSPSDSAVQRALCQLRSKAVLPVTLSRWAGPLFLPRALIRTRVPNRPKQKPRSSLLPYGIALFPGGPIHLPDL